MHKAFVTGLGWCWMEDGEILEVIEDLEESEEGSRYENLDNGRTIPKRITREDLFGVI